MVKMRSLTLTLALAALSGAANGQYITPNVYNIAGDRVYNSIVNEASGEQTLNYIIDMAAYELVNRNFDKLKESEYILAKGKEFGLDGLKLNRYNSTRDAWVAVEGELWIEGDIPTKIADIKDIPAVLVQGSASGDVTAKVIWIDDFSKKALAGKDIKGNIVMSDQSPAYMAASIKGLGAKGIITTYSRNPHTHGQQVPNSSMRPSSDSLVAFNISPLVGESLKRAAKRGGEPVVRAMAKTKSVSFDIQSPSYRIEGSDPSAGSIILCAHIFEGYVKLGANDNASGSAAILEVARLLNDLIESGELERPKRSIDFIWGDEFVGIAPWMHANPAIIDNAIANINLDMVGVSLSNDKSFFNAHLSRYSTSHYMNSVIANLFKYMGDTNSEYGASKHQVYAPSGSRDPFVYAVQDFSGYSDHELFMDPSFLIPSAMFITWPDFQYHTSEDRPDKLDATQLKRAVVLTAATAYTIASAQGDKGFEIASLVKSTAQKRMADIEDRCSHQITSYDGDDINSLYKNALQLTDATLQAQLMALESVMEIAPANDKLRAYVDKCKNDINSMGDGQKEGYNSLITNMFGKSPELSLTKQELEAQNTYPSYTAAAKARGYDSAGLRFGSYVGTSEPMLSAVNSRKLRSMLNGEALTEIIALSALNKFSELEILYMTNAQRADKDAITLDELSEILSIMEQDGVITINKK